MKARGPGLLENDSALDALGDIVDRVFGDLKKSLAPAKLTRSGAGELAAQIGLVAHYRGEWFGQKKGDLGYDKSQLVRDGIKKHRLALDAIAPQGKAALDTIVKGKPLSEKFTIDGLMRATHARPYLQDLADQAIEGLEGDYAARMGAQVDLLVTLSPYVEIPQDPINELLEALRDDGADETEAGRHVVRALKRLRSAAAANAAS